MLELTQQGGATTTIFLSKEQGEQLRELLEQTIDCRFTSYCHKVGVDYTNVSAYLGGRKKISLQMLQRILSATDLEVECQIKFLIQNNPTEDVVDADSTVLEDELFLEEMEESAGEQ